MRKIFEQQFKALPDLFLEKLVEKILREEGVNPDLVMIQQLVQHVLNSNSAPLICDDGKEGNISIAIDITEADEKVTEKSF